ncbi:MAG: fimbrial protein [Bacteroides sp.]
MKKIFYVVCVVLLLLACSADNEREIVGGEKGTLVLMVKPNNPSEKTRIVTEPGDDGLNENKVENLHVFVFPQNAADNQVCVKYESFSGITFQGTGTFTKDLATLQNQFTAGATYDIYALVNLPANVTLPNPITLGGLKSLRSVTPLASTGVQSNFVMDGKTSVVLNPLAVAPIVYIDMPVKRAVSKIRMKLVLAPGSAVAEATVAQVSLKHFAKSSALFAYTPVVLGASDYDQSAYVTGTPATTFTFYAYENNWSTTAANETYLMVNLPTPALASNYYRLPINKYANQVETGRIERNMVYEVVAYLDANGADSESGSVVVNGNCTLTDWTTKKIVLKTISQHYLGISEYALVMPNVAAYTLNYVSDLPVSVSNVTATCTQYSTTGVPSTVTYTSGQSQFPVFTVNAATNIIAISSAIPVNYVPKNVTFTVTNNQGLSLNATLVQYPARYVTARTSVGNIKPEWNAGGTNLNLFTVNTLVPSADGSYTLGDPTNGFAKTDSTAVGNKMVSPRFIIASQYGIYARVDYTTAQTRCFLYGEDVYRSGWRLPTKAEIELINKIQDDANSAVKGLLTGDAYWSAFKFDYYNFVNNTWTSTTNTGTAYVRAVYDLYKSEP